MLTVENGPHKKNTKWLHTANIFIVHLLLNLLEHVWAQTEAGYQSKQTVFVLSIIYSHFVTVQQSLPLA